MCMILQMITDVVSGLLRDPEVAYRDDLMLPSHVITSGKGPARDPFEGGPQDVVLDATAAYE